jgi:hypothetical protein
MSSMSGTPERRKAVGQTVKNHRLTHKQSVEAAATLAEMSHMTWRRIEAGDIVQDRSYSGIDKALFVPPGTTLRAVKGEIDLHEVVQHGFDKTWEQKRLLKDRRILTEKLKTDPENDELVKKLIALNLVLNSIEDEVSDLRGYEMWEVRKAREELSGRDPSPPPTLTVPAVPYLDEVEHAVEQLRTAGDSLEIILDNLVPLSLDELDKVQDALRATRRAKGASLSKEMGLPEARDFGVLVRRRAISSRYSSDTRHSVNNATRRYEQMFEFAARALTDKRTIEAENKYLKSSHTDDQLKDAEHAYDASVQMARRIVAQITDLLGEDAMKEVLMTLETAGR